MEKAKKENVIKKRFTICGYNIWEILTYFIIFSIFGFFIETLFGIVTKGVVESRKGFLYGPFCPIYGVGGVVMAFTLKYFKKNNFLLFIGGMLVGGVVEYVISYLGEVIFNTKWWDYSDKVLNINGRICLSFCIIWGFLAIYFERSFHPSVDRLMNYFKVKYNIKLLKTLVVIAIIFLVLDFVITTFSLKVFYARLVHDYNLEVANKQQYINDYENLRQYKVLFKITDKIFSNKFMLKTFPNLRMVAKDGSTIYVWQVLRNIEPYYIKLFTPGEVKIYDLDDKLKDALRYSFS